MLPNEICLVQILTEVGSLRLSHTWNSENRGDQSVYVK